MLKKSPSRGSRSKGIKVKHILQIALLVGVCCWLIYQVKRSHDKKKEFDQTDNEITTKTQGVVDVLKLGRKDLHPHYEEVHPGEKQEEDDEDETGGEEENSKHEEDEGHEAVNEEDEGSKHEEETEDDVREGGDDDIDENDQEKADNESDRVGENVNDERLKEGSDEEAGGNEERDKEDQRENENSSDDQENDSGELSTHEAREENYKGDDASSAVTHDDHSTTSETEKVNLENSNENSELNSKEQDGESSDTEELNRIQNSSRLTEVDKMADNGTVIENSSDVKLNGNTSVPTDGLVGNPILTTQSDDQPESSNSTSSTTETNKVENVDSSQQNGTDSQLTTEVDKKADNGTSTNDNPSDVKLNENISLPTDGSVENSILTTQSNDQSEPSNNSTPSAITETNNVENVDSSQQNGTELGLNHPEEKTIDNLTAQNETSLPSLILTNSNNTVLANNISESLPNTTSKDENPNGVEGETLNISNKADLTVTGDKTTEPEKGDKPTEPEKGDKPTKPEKGDKTTEPEKGDKTTESENVLPTTIIQENSESTQNEKLGDNGESGGVSSDSVNHTQNSVQEDPIDSNDSHVTERVDLDMLPDNISEVDHSKEIAAE